MLGSPQTVVQATVGLQCPCVQTFQTLPQESWQSLPAAQALWRHSVGLTLPQLSVQLPKFAQEVATQGGVHWPLSQ